jgi:putative transposase
MVVGVPGMSIRQHTITAAIESAHGLNYSPVLITDGGPENRFPELINSIVHKKALVDVHYSNSLIEAHNKLIKYNYLYRMEIQNIDELRTKIEFIASDFNNRPHVSLQGLTPNEAYENTSLDRQKLKLFTEAAAIERKMYNQTHRCAQCKG